MSDLLVGQGVILKATFRLSDESLVNPSGVTLIVEDPSGNQVTASHSNPSTGVFTSELDLDERGWWKYRWEGTTTEGTAVCEGTFCVKASNLVAA